MNAFESFLQARFGRTVARDPKAVNDSMRVVNSGGTKVQVAKEETYVYFPARFEQANLAVIEQYYRVVGYLAFVVGDNYCVLSIPNMLTMNPSSVQTVKIDEEDYYELHFEAGSTIIETLRLSKDSTLVYPIYNELVSKPNAPCYFNYKDALLCLQKCGKYANLSLEKTNVATEIIVATTTRDSNDPREQYRHILGTNKNAIPLFLGLRNIQFGVTNLPTAIMGSYSDIGIDSILVNPPKKLEKYEKLLRM